MVDEHITPVIFRKYGKRESNAVIALFPAECWSSDGYTCSCYVHVGQHGEADPFRVINTTKPAKPEEYADLKAELEAEPYGYRFRVYARYQRRWTQERREQMRNTS